MDCPIKFNLKYMFAKKKKLNEMLKVRNMDTKNRKWALQISTM